MPSSKFNIAWLDEQLGPIEFSTGEELVGVSVIMANRDVLEQFQRALKSAGTWENPRFFAGILLLKSDRIEDGYIVALAPFDCSFENVSSLFEQVLSAGYEEMVKGIYGRAKAIKLI